jgi:hypothetical protein
MSNEKLIAAEPEEVVLTVPFPLQIDGTVMDANGRVRLDISTKNIFVILADEQGTEIACMTENIGASFWDLGVAHELCSFAPTYEGQPPWHGVKGPNKEPIYPYIRIKVNRNGSDWNVYKHMGPKMKDLGPVLLHGSNPDVACKRNFMNAFNLLGVCIIMPILCCTNWKVVFRDPRTRECSVIVNQKTDTVTVAPGQNLFVAMAVAIAFDLDSMSLGCHKK